MEIKFLLFGFLSRGWSIENKEREFGIFFGKSN